MKAKPTDEMEFVSNATHPRDFHYYRMVKDGETKEQYEDWFCGFIWFPPKETDFYTVKQLEEMGLVGLYRPKAGTKLEQYMNSASGKAAMDARRDKLYDDDLVCGVPETK